MLHKIIIENFYSIADRQELDFAIPANAPDLPCFKESQSDKTIRLPSVIGFFGPNASGKSTILRAAVSAFRFIYESFNWNKDDIKFLFQPYRKKEWLGKPTKIIIEFDNKLDANAPSTLFRYEISITSKGLFDESMVSYESLSYSPKGKFRSLFEREGQVFRFSREFGIGQKDPREGSIRPDASVLSTLAKFNHPISSTIIQFVNQLRTNLVALHRLPATEYDIANAYANHKPCLDALNKELRRFDVGLESMIIEQGNNGLFPKFQHTGLDEPIFFLEESRGTQRFIEFFWRLYSILETGSVAIIDELDTDLHPLLLPEIFRWFGDSERNPHGAQLLFSAHNPALLDDLEKEQVFFTEKPSGKPSLVYGARDIKGLRREPSLMKKYLAGELGAVPHIG
jgi:AAA15 family ATPase/GTPase